MDVLHEVQRQYTQHRQGLDVFIVYQRHIGKASIYQHSWISSRFLAAWGSYSEAQADEVRCSRWLYVRNARRVVAIHCSHSVDAQVRALQAPHKQPQSLAMSAHKQPLVCTQTASYLAPARVGIQPRRMCQHVIPSRVSMQYSLACLMAQGV